MGSTLLLGRIRTDRGLAVAPISGTGPGFELVDEDDPNAVDKAFQDVLMTLRAMASSDDRIIDYFRNISRGERPSKLDSIIDFIVPDPVKVKFDVSLLKTRPP